MSRSAAIATVMSGEANEIAVASTIGSRASAEKLQNMPPMAVSPRPACPNGRPIRTAASSSRRQAKITTTGTMAKAERKNTTCPTG